MGIAVYAMFIGLLVPSVKKERKVGLIALIAMLINVLCSQFMSDGWSIVLATIIGGDSGVCLLKGGRACLLSLLLACLLRQWYQELIRHLLLLVYNSRNGL